MMIVDLCAEKLAEKTGLKDEDYDIMRYGLAVIYINLSKTAILLLCSALLGIFKETVILFLSYIIIRCVGFGYHSDNSIKCTIVGIFEFIGATVVAITIKPLTMPICALLLLASVVTFGMYAPVETDKRRISGRKKKIFKSLVLLITCVMGCLSGIVGENIYRNLIVMGICLEAVSILPIMKKILK